MVQKNYTHKKFYSTGSIMHTNFKRLSCRR